MAFMTNIKLTLFLILVACMAAAALNNVGNAAVFDICALTDFKETCHKSLGGAYGAQPKDLIKAELDATTVELQSVVEKVAAYKTAPYDSMTQGAVIVCEKELNMAIDYVTMSSKKVNEIEIGRLSFNIADVRKWLSASVTYKGNCIDALESTTGGIAEKMMAMLKTSSELLSNGLAMITNIDPHLLGDESPDQEIPSVVAPQPKIVTVSNDKKIPRNFSTITDAIHTMSVNKTGPVVILVKAGTYHENVTVPRGMDDVSLIGDGPLKTIITGNRSNATGFSIKDSATLGVDAKGFIAKNIKIENTAPRTQAVAVRVSGDQAVFHNVHIESLQDTLYAENFHQFYRNCRISGTIDFIFGDAVAVFQKCEIVVRKPIPGQQCTITAQGREQAKGDGVTVIQGCTITAEEALRKANPPVLSYLGRPWKNFSRTIVMQSEIGHFISRDGWLAWENTTRGFGTLYYGEYCNFGHRANTSHRVEWEKPGNLTADIAANFTPQKVFMNNDAWVKSSGVPYFPGFLPLTKPCGAER